MPLDVVKSHDMPATLEPAARALVRAVLANQPALLVGPSGVGKTMLARRMARVLTLDDHARRWVSAEHEGLFRERPRDRDLAPPFRAPHHTVSAAAMTGTSWGWRHHTTCSTLTYPGCACGLRARPSSLPIPAYVKTDPGSRGGVWDPGRAGEVELARFGVLFLDELPEFTRQTIEATAARRRQMTAGRPRVIAAASPCACGWAGSTVRACTCSPTSLARWAARVDEFCAMLKIAVRITIPTVSVASARGPRCAPLAEILAEIGGAA